MESCAICLDTFKKHLKYIHLQCAHGFHRICIKEWFAQTHTCPICRTDVQFTDEYNILTKGGDDLEESSSDDESITISSDEDYGSDWDDFQQQQQQTISWEDLGPDENLSEVCPRKPLLWKMVTRNGQEIELFLH